MQKNKTNFKKLLLFVFLLAFLWGSAWVVNIGTDRLIFRPSFDEQALLMPFTSLHLPTANGQKIHALYLPAEKDKETLLFFHGRSYNITHFQDFAQMYHTYGYGILLFDYRGFGQSKGKITEKNMYQDGQTALNYLLQDRQIPPQKIVLWGHSLGCAIAIETARKNPLPFQAVILQSPFTNTSEMGFFLFGGSFDPSNFWHVWGAKGLTPLVWNKKFDNLTKIATLTQPLLIGYSDKDKTIPWQMSAKLAAKAPVGTQAYLSSFGEHGEFEWFRQKGLEFLEGRD